MQGRVAQLARTYQKTRGSVLMEADVQRRYLFLLACLAQKAHRYSLARPAWEKYLATRCGGSDDTLDMSNCEILES